MTTMKTRSIYPADGDNYGIIRKKKRFNSLRLEIRQTEVLKGYPDLAQKKSENITETPEPPARTEKEKQVQAKEKSGNALSEATTDAPLKHVEDGVFDKPPIKIARVSGKPFANASEAETFALKNLRGKYLNKDTNWEIDVYRRGIEKALSGKSKVGDSHIQAISRLPEQLENAVLVETRPPKEENTGIRKIHRFFAPVDINGVLYRAKLTVKETDEGQKFYDQSLTEIEKADAEMSPSVNSEESASRDRSSTFKNQYSRFTERRNQR